MKHKLLVILGPTSTGKTDLGIELAKKLNGEIISADSRQVYEYLDTGTGKLPGKFKTFKKGQGLWEIDGVKIRMYDVAEPKTRFNLYQYISKAGQIIRKISSQEKLPILVGGTGLYIRSLLEGISDFEAAEDQSLRVELGQLDLDLLRQKIHQLNPGALDKLNNSELNNKRRLIRLLEKLTNPGTGKSFPGIEADFDVLKIGLNADRQILNERIGARVISRIGQGMVEEAEQLLNRGVLTYQRMDELGLEYRYLARLLKGEINRDEFTAILTVKICQFAKRQMTWFKKEKNTQWFDTGDERFSEKVVYRVANWYNNTDEQKD